MNPLRIAVDFDGVLHDPLNVLPGYKLGQPIEGAVEAVNALKAQGCLIVIHSVWANGEKQRHAMAEWLHYFNIPYDFITNVKPVVDLMIDNNGYRFERWSDTLEFIKTWNGPLEGPQHEVYTSESGKDSDS